MINPINTINNKTSLASLKAKADALNHNSNSTQPFVVRNGAVLPTLSFGNVSVTVNTQLRTAEEREKYSKVFENLDNKCKLKLEVLLKNGRLLNNDSNDKTTTLDNLYNIVVNKRADGLDTKGILKDVVTAVDNPYTITQKFGDIPKRFSDEIIAKSDKFSTYDQPYSNYVEAILATGKMPQKQKLTKEDLNIASSSCVAASIQFNLAYKNPAEYARMAEKLSSDNSSVDKNIKLTDIAPDKKDAEWLLQQFKVPYEEIDAENIKVNMKPDKNSIIRARIQSSSLYRDAGERSPIDVLMQSTFMNIGSQQTYNALTDVRTGKFNPDNRGLTDIEKNLAEVLAQGKSKISVTYQILDETGKIVGYECSHENTLKHIKDSLRLGENVIVGYTHTDENNKVINGHEITIIGIDKDKNGKEYFICNDTDDMKDGPVRYEVGYLLPKIHHAGLPKEVLKNDGKLFNAWTETINQYKEVMLPSNIDNNHKVTLLSNDHVKHNISNSIYDDNLQYRLAMAKVKLAGSANKSYMSPVV